jgi:urease accessory protein
MRMRTLLSKSLPVATLVLAPGLAMAHPGHGIGDNLAAGLMHPLGGLDHVLMILAVAAWAALLQPAGRAIVAATLALCVGIGALLPVPPGTVLEAAIALTVVGAGILLAVGRRWPLWATSALAAAFALVHGFAHGAEGPGINSAYVAGVMLSTGLLALLVSNLAAQLQARSVWLRITGMISAAIGVATLAG